MVLYLAEFDCLDPKTGRDWHRRVGITAVDSEGARQVTERSFKPFQPRNIKVKVLEEGDLNDH